MSIYADLDQAEIALTKADISEIGDELFAEIAPLLTEAKSHTEDVLHALRDVASDNTKK